MPTNDKPRIGVFDSGVGGLSVLNTIRTQISGIPLEYVGDQFHVPYGQRSQEEIRSYSDSIAQFLIEQDASLIVIACNTASAVALQYLRNKYPEIVFVGMEPAVKPAAEYTKSGVVGVLATPATFDGGLYSSVVERFARGVTILQDTCPGLVNQIEHGYLDSAITEEILSKALIPMINQGIDTVVLGCTHYPFVIPLIRKIVGNEIRIIDPAPAVARQVGRLIGGYSNRSGPVNDVAINYYTTIAPAPMELLLPKLVGENGNVIELRWKANKLQRV